MIKINVISNNKVWYQHLKNPKINRKYKKYKKKKIYCTLLLSGASEIKKLNKKFRLINKSTDILSFPFYEKNDFRKKLKTEKEIYLGDIIINFNMVVLKKNKLNFLDEFNKLWIHGLTHLFGYDHKKNKDFKVMIQFEKKLLSFIK